MLDKQIRFRPRTPFAIALKNRADAYFAESGQSRGGGAPMILKSALIFGWLGLVYAFLPAAADSWLALLAIGLGCGLATAGLGMAVQHDGGHLAYSDSRTVNRIAAAVLDFLGASSYVWRVKHGTVHHTYPNIEGVDDDIDAQPFARMSPGQTWRKMHEFQHLYIWPLYGFLIAKWFFYDDFRDIAAGQVGRYPFARPRGLDLAIFVGGKVVHLTWALIIPIMLVGVAKGIVFYAVLAGSCGVVLSIVFQLAHCVEDNAFVPVTPRLALDFAEHQLATTADFARNNRVLSWYVGGLNFQAVHHLFPRVCHLHYPALSRILEATAAEFGVTYRASPSLLRAVRSHYRWLKRMGTGDSGVPASGELSRAAGTAS